MEQEATSRLATVRLVSPGQTASGVVVDLLFASSGIEPEIVAAADPLEVFPGVTLPVACRGHLIALKTLSRDDRHGLRTSLTSGLCSSARQVMIWSSHESRSDSLARAATIAIGI